MKKSMSGHRWIRIVHRPSSAVIAAGSLGWSITPWEGNYYLSRNTLAAGKFRPTWLHGICMYKGVYRWLDFVAPDGSESRDLAWRYVVPNPLIPFIWFRVGIPGQHPDLEISVMEETPRRQPFLPQPPRADTGPPPGRAA